MNRAALVTGGTRGIGAAISSALQSAGYKVAANYNNNDEAAEIFRNETGIFTCKWDVSDFNACTLGVKKVQDECGPVDILVNNAGITRDTVLHKMDVRQWSEVIKTNLDSVFNMTRTVIEGMRERQFGRIVSISSVNGQKGQIGQANYAAAKAGLIGFIKTVAQENARKGITANVIAPGYILTDMLQTIPRDLIEKKILPQIPADRLGKTEEIARCVVFLVSEESGWITGSTMSINGGQSMI
ncbi:MAG: acetoacetyl-CoA reductase [Alphaproteobacteria bacterium]|nr:acetoacetyl-CoA reductase [Alphaproteobacteria bacterium]